MGSTEHGAPQNITIEYYEEATSFDVNKRNVNIVPRGIYSGGHLTRVSDTEVTLSAFTAEIGDDDIQISVETSAAATLNSTTLDSGAISESTPVLVLRWSYVAQQNNYVEVHAIASASSAQANDIIIGTCQFSAGTLTGFDYSDRTFLNIQDLFLKVEEDSGLYVWIRNGRIYTSSGYVTVPEQRVGPFSVPSSPNNRIDLVYVDTDGTVSIQTGTAAVSPSASDYDGKLVVAEVRINNGDTSIPASQITDARSFITAKSTQFSPTSYTGGESVTYPNGRIEKEGTVAMSGSPQAVSFSSAFPTQCTNVQLSVQDSDNYPSNPNYNPHFDNLSRTGFTVYLEKASATVHWRATGY